MWEIADDYNIAPKLYLSTSQSSLDDPLDFWQKYHWCSLAFGSCVQRTQVKDFFEAVKLQEGDPDLIVVLGEDQMSGAAERIAKYNGDLYHFETLEFVSAGQRVDYDCIAFDLPFRISASAMRELAQAGRYDEFKRGLPRDLKIDEEWSKRIYGEVRDGLDFKRRDKRAARYNKSALGSLKGDSQIVHPQG